MKYFLIILLGMALVGCREKPAPQPTDAPVQKPTASEAASPTPGGAISDVLTQRPVIEAGKRAKVQVEAARAEENKAIEEAMRE